jgi:hypothetical protein
LVGFEGENGGHHEIFGVVGEISGLFMGNLSGYSERDY